jgi:hypothetical protein
MNKQDGRHGWNTMPLSERLEVIRKRYFTGPHTSPTEAKVSTAVSETLREAIVQAQAAESPAPRCSWCGADRPCASVHCPFPARAVPPPAIIPQQRYPAEGGAVDAEGNQLDWCDP